MPCLYPHGPEEDWCERHVRDHAMVQTLRNAPPTAAPIPA